MIHARQDYNRIQDPSGKIADDEPVFLLRAKDVLAPMCLILWAEELITRGGDKDIAGIVADHAAKMIAWQEKNGCKLPDLPKNYNDQIPATSPRIESNALANIESIIENGEMLGLIITAEESGKGAHFFISGYAYKLEQLLVAFMNSYPDFKEIIENALYALNEKS